MSLAEGEAALAAGDWAAARTAFEAAEPTAEALAGLGTALMWLGDIDAAVQAREQAYAAFCRRPEPMHAAITALSLYFLFRSSLGNVAASRGWLARAARLAGELDLPPLTGWVQCARAHDSDDPLAAEGLAREAHDAARAAGDADLELCALSQIGIALVDQGRVAEGAAMLDEAMAASLAGEGEQIQTVVYTSCNMIMACSRAAQFDRATQWIRAAGPFTQRYGSPHLFTLCRLHHGKVMVWTGDWAAAEAELEAAELVAPVGDHPATTGVQAALHLAREEPAAAEALLRRRRARRGSAGERRAARAAVRGRARGRPPRRGDGDRAPAVGAGVANELRGGRRPRRARHGDHDRGRGGAGTRVGAVRRARDAARGRRTQLQLARVLDGEPGVAAGRAALGTFERLGAGRDADAAAALLRSFGVRPARAASRGPDVLTRREREVLALLGDGLTNRAIAERLFISQKTAQHHVANVRFKLDLANRAQAAAYAVRHLHESENA